MSVDLANYVSAVRAAVSPPGSDLFGDALDTDWVDQLIGGFWDARLDGFLGTWTENADGVTSGIVTPRVAGAVDIPRDMIQLVILYAALNALRGLLTNLKVQFKAQAGSVSVEQQQSTNLLRDIYKSLLDRRLQLWRSLSSEGFVQLGYLNALSERDWGLWDGTSWWER